MLLGDPVNAPLADITAPLTATSTLDPFDDATTASTLLDAAL
jgi:hypothetical protein